MTAELRQLIFMGEQGTTIEEASKVRLGLVITICATLAGGIWWAASLQAKVDALLSNSAQHIIADRDQSAAISDLRHEMDLMRIRTSDLERKVKGPN